MLWGYTMFPNNGYSTKPVYITSIEDKNGNLLESFSTSINQVISESSAYTMCKMMQGVVDIGTAKGLRSRLGAAEMGGKTGTTNDNSDAWFFGYTPQLLGGTWVGCDNRFIRLSSTLGMGGQAARPILEYFMQKVYADKTLGIEKDVKFIQPESMKNDAMFDYKNIIDQTPPPGAEGNDQGNGSANEYMTDQDTTTLKSNLKEAPLTPDEQKVLKEATIPKDKDKKNEKAPPADKPAATENEKDGKKKKGFFGRLFGNGNGAKTDN